MPTYSYRCTECGTAFDIKQSFTDAALTECPSCGGVLRKVFGAVGVTFNGSGFYRTDSRSSGAAGSSTPASTSASSSAKGGSGTSTSTGSSGSGSSGSGSSTSSTASTSSAAAS